MKTPTPQHFIFNNILNGVLRKRVRVQGHARMQHTKQSALPHDRYMIVNVVFNDPCVSMRANSQESESHGFMNSINMIILLLLLVFCNFPPSAIRKVTLIFIYHYESLQLI